MTIAIRIRMYTVELNKNPTHETDSPVDLLFCAVAGVRENHIERRKAISYDWF